MLPWKWKRSEHNVETKCVNYNVKFDFLYVRISFSPLSVNVVHQKIEKLQNLFFLNSIRLDFEVYASTTLTLQYPEFKGSDSWLFIVCTVKQLIEHYLFVLIALTAVIKNNTTGKKKNTQNTLVLSAALPLELPLLIFVK